MRTRLVIVLLAAAAHPALAQQKYQHQQLHRLPLLARPGHHRPPSSSRTSTGLVWRKRQNARSCKMQLQSWSRR